LGLYHFGDRWYDPLNGRFISQDPTGFSASDANLYRYVSNQPTDAIDPTGDSILQLLNILGLGQGNTQQTPPPLMPPDKKRGKGDIQDYFRPIFLA
jgi:uncharacterized protein RhaS with RHS repeats